MELFSGCIVFTGQEAPETNKKVREDLFKKAMSADGIARRKPYGITARLLELLDLRSILLALCVTPQSAAKGMYVCKRVCCIQNE